jgi:DNA-binding CsgD family transcriptional regulator/tetratricopeptide (TPR) repeat protein
MTTQVSKGRPAKREQMLVGRQSELALISRLLDEAKSGKGSFLGISGEPGIGKTRLAEAAAVAARKRGFTTFWGQCHDGQYIPPYWPWREPLRGLLKMLPPSRRKNGKNRFQEGLSGIVSEGFQVTRSTRAMPKPVSQQARLLILESATDLIRTISVRKPLLLIMDNLHCADVPSLQLLEVIAREMRGQNVMIIGSYREPVADSSAEFRPAIGALASQEFFHGIALSGWDLVAISEYLRTCGIAEPPAVLLRAVLDRTEGNPLFVGEVVNLLKHEGLLNIAAAEDVGAWEKHIPQKIRLAILGQVQRLSVPCRDVLSLAALAGREFESVILRQTTQMTGAVIEQAIEEAIAHGIITEDAERPGLYKFMHALIQDVVVEQIPVHRRAALHLKIGKALERRYTRELGTHAGELARHFDSAGPEAVKRAVHYYRLAGERALRMHGFEDALAQLGRAFRLEKGKGSALETARLLFGLAQSQHGAARFREAVETYTRAFDLFEQSGEIDNAVRILEQPLILAEEGADAIGLLERAIALAGPGTLRAEALGGKYGLAVYHATGDYQKAAILFDRALHAARESGDRPQELGALMNRGHIECDELHFEVAHRLEQESYQLAQEADDFWIELNSLANDVQSLLGLGRLADAEKRLHILKPLTDRAQIRTWTAIISNFCFAVQRQKGALAIAREINEKALALGADPYGLWNLIDRALLEFEEGDTAHGAQFLQKLEEEAHLADVYLVFHWEGWLILLVSLIAWVTGEQMQLEGVESSARALLSKGGLRKGDVVHLHAGLGLIAVIRKDAEAARKHYRELSPFSGLVICPYQGIAADHLLALLAQTTGDHARARNHFDAALAFCRKQKLTLELAYTCRDYAEFLLGGEEMRDATLAAGLCQEADLIARHSGLPRLTERLQELQKHLVQSRPVSPPYPDSLSEREVEVLRLLAEGLSNAQIGDRLFISLHTVASHVQKILEKTGTVNRTEAALYAVRCGLKGTEKHRT